MSRPRPPYELFRSIPAETDHDVVVLGGGPAGAAAAVAAARQGRRTVLVEATGCLGGMGTSGLVTAFDPMANGERGLVAGFQREVVEELHARGFLGPDVTPEYWLRKYRTWTPFNSEGYKLVLDEKLAEAGVEVRFFTRVIDADTRDNDGVSTLNGVVLHNVEGYRYAEARTFIDCTGDAILADLCGVACREAGRDTPGIMPATLPSLLAGVDWDRFRASGVDLRQLYFEAMNRGEFSQYDRLFIAPYKTGRRTAYLNGGHVFGLDALRNRSMSDGVALGRRIAQEFLRIYRDHVPGFEHVEHVTTANLIGVRESRRIVGEYTLRLDDYQARRQFPDQIGVFNKFVDIHPYDCSEAQWERHLLEKETTCRLDPGECFGIPYGILVPRRWSNLWVAGRCASTDVATHGCVRVQPACSMMGQAAGTAAAQAVATGTPAFALDTARLVDTLRDAGAYLPQERTRPRPTRTRAAA